MRVALAAVLVLLVPGCLNAGPGATTSNADGEASSILTDAVLAEALPFLADDGVTIDMHVFRPDVAQPVPIIINFSPYWSNLSPPAADGGDAYSLYLIDYFVPRGYAVVLVSARGTGLSEGCFSIGGGREIEDMDQILDFLAEQPWTNGNMAAVGKSYDGTMAQGLLTRNDPHLKTIVPVSPISEFYKYNYVNGVPYDFGGLLFNTYYVAEVSVAQNQDPTSPTWATTPTRACDEAANVQAYQYHAALTGDYSAYWQERNYTALLPESPTASVFYVHGLQDWNVKPDHMTPWLDELYARNVTVKAWLGQWAHDYPHRGDNNETMLRWFDFTLKGVQNGILDEPRVQVQDNEGNWRDEDRWPPARVTPLVLYPSADDTLGPEPGTGSAAYGDAPAGVLLEAPAGSDVYYESAPLERPLRIAGIPTFTATVSATGARATLAVAILVDGEVVDQGFLDLAHRNGPASAEPMTPGESYQVSLQLYPQDLVVPAGATIGLLLSSAEPAGSMVNVMPFSAGGVVTIGHGAGTALTLPTLAYEDAAIEDPQPEDLGCWTC